MIITLICGSVFADGTIHNVAPTVDFSVALKKDIDLVIVTDYSGADITNINSQINNLKIAASGKYNIKTHFIGVDGTTKSPKTVTIGQQTSDIMKYSYQRSFKIHYNRTGYEQSSTGTTNYNNSYDLKIIPYETAVIYPGDTLPAFQFGNNYTFRLVQAGIGEQLSMAAYIYDKYEVFDPNNADASRKNYNMQTQFVSAFGYTYVLSNYNITSTSLDTKWSLTGIGKETKTTSYQAVNLNDLSSLSMKPDSEKYVIFLSKGEKAESYRDWGKYFAFGSMKNSNIGSFISNNNPNIYTIMPTEALDLKLNQTTHRLDRVPGQELSINELYSKTNGEVQHYGADKFSAAIEHLKIKYSDRNSNKVDIKVATDYTGTKLNTLNTELATLKTDMQNYGINVNYELFSDKKVGSSKQQKNKKIDGYYNNRLVLKDDGSLYYYKTASDTFNRYSLIDPQLIFQQYPYAQTKITRQTQSIRGYDEDGNRAWIEAPVSMGHSFQSRPIPPVIISQNVTDAAFVQNYIFYLKQGTLYAIVNKKGGVSNPDEYVHAAITNGTDINKIITGPNTLFTIKNDGSLWVISGEQLMYAAGYYADYNQIPQEVRSGLSSFTLCKVGGGSYINNVKFKDVAMSGNHAVGLTVNGEVYGWGNNTFGQLGNGSSASFSGSSYTPVEYKHPVKANITDVVSIACYQHGTYFINQMGIAYFSGLAGYTYEKSNPNSTEPLPSYNPQPVPYYMNKAALSKYKYYTYWTYSGSVVSYYQVYHYVTSPMTLYSDGIQEIATGMTMNKHKLAMNAFVLRATGTITIDFNDFKTSLSNTFSNNLNNNWASYTPQDRQKKIDDYNTSFNALFSTSIKEHIFYDSSNNTVSPIQYAAIDNLGNLRDNIMFPTSAEVYNDNSAFIANNASLQTYYNVDATAVNTMLNTATVRSFMCLDLAPVAASSLQNSSDRYFFYASDTYGTIEDNEANYLSLQDLPSSFIAYLANSNYKAYAVAPTSNIADVNINKLLNNKTGVYTSISILTNMIKRLYNPASFAPANYIIVNEDEVIYKDAYSDYENDPAHREQFMYEHDPSVFENNTGVISNNGQWINAPINKFSKKGKYVIHYRAQDTASASDVFANYRKWSNESIYTLFVHERPVALTNVTITPNGSFFTITASDGGSYDNDHLSRTDKGIVAHEWRWKESSEADWHYGNVNISNATSSRVYLIDHRVRDMEGAWSNWSSMTVDNASPPIAQYTLDKNTITTQEQLRLRDTSYAGFGTLTRWQWTIVNLSNNSIVRNTHHTNSNTGTGTMAGYDINVKTDYSDVGPGTYRIYLRVKASNGLWSDGGTDALTGYNLSNCYYQDIVVKEAFKLEKFRVMMVRDLQLESYYYNSSIRNYEDKPMGVNSLAVDAINFGSMTSGLAKGYMFEYEIDSTNFNESLDTIVITPHFYTGDLFSRDAAERDLYWEDSKHQIWKAGQGGHAPWNTITLRAADRTITGADTATWRGEYLIPATAWAVPAGTLAANAKSMNLRRDIIVNFEIKGYKAGVLKFDYNVTQWPLERTVNKAPYQVGDVIKYSHSKNSLDDIKVRDNR